MKLIWKILFICNISVLLACGSKHPTIIIKTELGEIQVEIYEEKAPITASNFLRYTDAGAFEGGTFYRVVTMDNQPNNEIKIEVIQGGRNRDMEAYDAIEHETTDKTGILHKDGVISMARGQPGSATSEFFICVGDQPELDFGGKRNPDGQGFAAFGKVVNGMDVVRRIHKQPVEEQRLNPSIKIVNIERAG